ncbi:MAG: hypothetical protein ACRD2T_01235, partial [Thermoanaerobaculia bacterium]
MSPVSLPAVVVEATLKLSLVLAVAALLDLPLRRAAAATRHLLWSAVIVLAALLPLLVAFGPRLPAPWLDRVGSMRMPLTPPPADLVAPPPAPAAA